VRSRRIFPSSALSAGLLVCYLFIFLTVNLLHRTPVAGYETDGVDFMLRARSIPLGRFVPPDYGTTSTAIYALWLVNRVVPDVFTASKILAGLSGALFLLGAIRLARDFSERTALLTGILLLASPWFLFYSNSCMSDLLAAAVVTLLIVQRNNLVAGALLAGLAWGIRPVTIVFLPILLPAVLKSPGHRLRRACFALTAFIAGTMPQLLASWRYYGDPFYSENWRNIAALIRPAEQVDRMHRFLELPAYDLLRILSIWLKRIFGDTPEQTVHVIYGSAAFAIPGAVLLWNLKDEERLTRRIWLAVSVLYIAVIQLTWNMELRYYLPVLPVLVIAAAFGLEYICGSRRTLYFTTAAFLIVTTAAAGVSGTARLLRLQYPELKLAGDYIKERPQAAGTVLASTLQSIFYSERSGNLLEELAPEDRNSLAATIDARRVRWIVADNRLAKEVPSLTWLDDEALTHAHFPDWKAISFGGDLHVLVWEIP
jgi:hypothetical protein